MTTPGPRLDANGCCLVLLGCSLVPAETAISTTTPVAVGGYDNRIRLTMRDLRVPLAALPP